MEENKKLQRIVDQAKYRAQQLEAELNAVRSSRAYKAAKLYGTLKRQITSDPVGLTKKVAKILVNDPKRLTHIIRSTNRVNTLAESVADQTGRYKEWILLNEPDEAELAKQREESSHFTYTPLISIVTPVFNPPVDVLEELIESVLEQTYPNFELYLGNFGDDPNVVKLLDKYAELDHRVIHKVFKENGGIAANSNLILKRIKGEYIGLLDHDDTLSPDALFENVKLLNEDNYDFIYSDKDKIDEAGNRFEPLFKPKLSPEMLLNINYLTHFNVMRTEIVSAIGGWDVTTNGAQDWDLFLRVIAAAKKVAHIPKILYHWRVIASSTAMSIETKPYALAGQRNSVDKYLKLKHVPATSYHRKTELFLKWDEASLDQKPTVFIYYSNAAHTLRTIRHIRHIVSSPTFFVLSKNEDDKQIKKSLVGVGQKIKTLTYKDGELFEAIQRGLEQSSGSSTTLFIRDDIKLPRNKWYEDLTGWLLIPEVAATSGRLVDKRELIVDSGAVINGNGEYVPIFQGFPRFYQGYIGNAEWVRDLTILSSNYMATKTDLLKKFFSTHPSQTNPVLDDYMLWASEHYRLVMTPHATAEVDDTTSISKRHKISNSHYTKAGFVDEYSNKNLSADSPMHLLAEEGFDAMNPVTQTVDAYQHDATILAESFDITDEEIKANEKLLVKKLSRKPTSVAWLLPSYEAVYAGLMNIFSFANYLNTTGGLKTTVYILKNSPDVSNEKAQAVAAFPSLKNAQFVALDPTQVGMIKNHDIGIATQWATTYPLAKSLSVARKYYFIQDNEVNFYPKGSISSLVELSYTFGFTAIANTQGLLDLYEKQYGGKGFVVKSLVDLTSYVPRKDIYYEPKPTYKVFFYARPSMPRNAFELGIAGLKQLKEQLGSKVDIITAGAAWDADLYGVKGLFTNLGKVDYNSVPSLYRSVDAGLMFMFSGHPGVTASELMASGCPVVVNEYNDVTWHELYKDGETCLITRSTASEVARNIRRLLEDQDLREKLIDGGLKITKSFYNGYSESCDHALGYMKEN